MNENSKRDIAAGVTIALFGIWFAGYAALKLPLGSFAKMGSGMFPFLTGAGLAICGATLASQKFVAWRRALASVEPDVGEAEPVQWASLVIVVAAISAFAFLIRPFGLAPATFALILVASTASKELRPWVAALLACALTALAYLIFIVGLGLPFDLIKWPF